jgi:hypothetical protein
MERNGADNMVLKVITRDIEFDESMFELQLNLDRDLGYRF